MKKWFYIVTLVAAAALAGCTKSEVTAPASKAVSFQVGSYAPQTKAISLIEDDITSFQCKAYMVGEGVSDVQKFFGDNGEVITPDSIPDPYDPETATAPTLWSPSHEYYWPKSTNSYVNFISWVGGNADNTAVDYSATDGATFAWNEIEIGQNDNLLWADMAWRYNENVKPATYGMDGVIEGVPTLFHHALAQVRVLAKVAEPTNTDGVSWEVKLKSVLINGVSNKGSLSMTNTDPGSKGTKSWTLPETENVWTIDETAETISVGEEKTSPLVLSTEPQDFFGWWNVIPQPVREKTISVEFLVKTIYGTFGPTVEETVYVNGFSLADTDVANWDMNTRITYTLTINPDTGVITIIPEEKTWVVNSEYSINIDDIEY